MSMIDTYLLYILLLCISLLFFFFFKQKTAYEMRISDWSSDVCSSDLLDDHPPLRRVKIRHKPPHRMLPPKLHPTRPQAQLLPQKHLGRRHHPSQRACFLDGGPDRKSVV